MYDTRAASSAGVSFSPAARRARGGDASQKLCAEAFEHWSVTRGVGAERCVGGKGVPQQQWAASAGPGEGRGAPGSVGRGDLRCFSTSDFGTMLPDACRPRVKRTCVPRSALRLLRYITSTGAQK